MRCKTAAHQCKSPTQKQKPQLLTTYPTKQAIYCKTYYLTLAFGILDQLTLDDFHYNLYPKVIGVAGRRQEWETPGA
jgi:hypothetical protein